MDIIIADCDATVQALACGCTSAAIVLPIKYDEDRCLIIFIHEGFLTETPLVKVKPLERYNQHLGYAELINESSEELDDFSAAVRWLCHQGLGEYIERLNIN